MSMHPETAQCVLDELSRGLREPRGYTYVDETAPASTAEFTYREARLAARWLRRQAEAAGVRDADLKRERLRARARIAGQKRDAQGRWTR